MEDETEYSVYQVELAVIRKMLLKCLYGEEVGSNGLQIPTTPQEAVDIRTFVHQVTNKLERYKGLPEQFHQKKGNDIFRE